jgi:hypothetical protein
MDPFEYKNSNGRSIEIGDKIEIKGQPGSSYNVISKKK